MLEVNVHIRRRIRRHGSPQQHKRSQVSTTSFPPQLSTTSLLSAALHNSSHPQRSKYLLQTDGNMPCDDRTHNRDWPAADAELVVDTCETRCAYCPPEKVKVVRDASALRRHVYTHHVDPAMKHLLPASHGTVTIKDYEYVPAYLTHCLKWS